MPGCTSWNSKADRPSGRPLLIGGRHAMNRLPAQAFFGPDAIFFSRLFMKHLENTVLA